MDLGWSISSHHWVGHVNNYRYSYDNSKILWHLNAIIKICIYRLLFGNNISFPFSSTFRERFNLTISGGKLTVGNNVFFNHDCSITVQGADITIDTGTLFGENVKIYCHNHCYQNHSMPIKKQSYTSAPVHIGKHCWICSDVVILKGVTIGDNSVIGAGCIVYKDIPANTIVICKQEHSYKNNI